MNLNHLNTSSENDIDSFLQRFDQRRSSDQGFNNNQSSTTKQVHLASNLASFLDQRRLPANTDVLSFWDERKNIDPQLNLLANVVLATPPTQVSVGRLFSFLKFVVNNLRMSLKDTLIDDILLICHNHLYDN